MIKGTARSFLLGSLIVSAAGFSACSDDDIAVSGSGGAEANGGAAVGSGGKAVGGTTGAKAGATSVGGGTATGGATGVGGGTAGGTATGTGGATGVGGGTAGGTATGTGGTTGVGGGTVATGGATTAGSAGRSTTGGTTSASGGTATGGSTYTISVAGAPQTTATGVAVLTTPLAGLGQGQRYNYENRDGRGTYDLTSASLNILACAPGAIGGNLHIFFTTLGRFDSPAFTIPLSAIANGFTTISIPVPPASGSYDPAALFVIRIEVEAGTVVGTTWQTPATIIYFDRIWSSNGVLDSPFTDNFTAGTANYLLTTSGAASTVAGSTALWLSQITVSSGSGGAGGTGGQSGTAGSAGITNVAGNTNIAGNLGVAGSSSTAGNAGSISGGGASAGSGG